jgi:ribosomal protein S1
VNHPREVVRVGDDIEVYILGLDKEEQRIALSRKRLLPNPWSLAEDNYAVGQLVEGIVTRIVSYGAFVEIEPGIEGLLHISQLSRENVEDAHEFINEGETHLLRVISLDTDRQRIGLSLKNVTASEQIEWMAKREMESAARAIEQEAESVRSADEVEIADEVAPDEHLESVTPADDPDTAIDDGVIAEVKALINLDEEE